MAATYLHKLRQFNRNTRLMLVNAALMGASFVGIWGVVVSLYLLRLGYGSEFIGLLFAAGLLTFAMASLPAGALGSRWGVRRLVIVAWCGMLAHVILLPLVELLPGVLRPAWLVGVFVLGHVSSAAYHVNASPYLMATTTDEERDHAFSVYFAIFPLAGFVGSLAGGLLPGLFARLAGVSPDGPAPYRYAFLINIVLMTPGLPALLATRKAAAGGKRDTVRKADPLPLAAIATLTLATLLLFAGYGVLWTFFNVYLDAGLHLPTGLIGGVMALGNLLPGMVGLAAPLAMARWGKGHTVLVGYVGMTLSLLPLALVPNWVAAGIGYVGFLCLMALMQPALTVFGQEAVAPGWRPTMSGALLLAQGASMAALALGGGYAISALGYRSPYWIAAGLTAAGAVVFWAIFLRTRKGKSARTVDAASEPDG
jgi:MFS family permease